ncbi:MAG: hypothetical protein JRJ84_00325 [Deltaproteobacteria bacterium]|nr:hypothetical protein [Deltaproteobacteria bacterium]
MPPIRSIAGVLLLGTLLTLSAPASAGEPVLFPDVTPATTSEFALAFMLQELVRHEMEREGHVVLSTKAVRPVVGDAVDACADVAKCPFAALQQLPARVAVVIRVVRLEGGLHGEVGFYERGDTAPVETRQYLILPGAEGEFARNLSLVTTDILSLVGPTSTDDIKWAVRLVEDADAAERAAQAMEEAAETEEYIEPLPPRPPVEPVEERDISELSFERRLEGTGIFPRHITGSKRHFMKSNLDPRDWLYVAMPHAGRFVFEVRGGMGIGDEDRDADVRVVLDDNNDNVSEWYQEGPTYSERVRGSLYAGYAPTSWLDVGLLFGLQYSQKSLSTGWRPEGSDTGSSGQADPVSAVMVYLEPRVRVYPITTGIAKPFLLVAPDFRFFDDFHIIDPTDPPVDYPDPTGGVVFGATGGGGLMIDPGPIVGFFAEGTYTQHLGLRAEASETATPRPSDAPPAPEGRGYTVAVEAGVQFRL